MADFTGNPLVFEAQDEAYPERVYVLAVHAPYPPNSGISTEFQDSKGRVLFTIEGVADGAPPSLGELGWVDGIRASYLESGAVINVFIR